MLSMYLNGSTLITPLSGLTAYPSFTITCTRYTRKNSRNAAVLYIRWVFERIRIPSSFMLFTKYSVPRILDRNTTEIPNTQTQGLSKASSPWLPFAHDDITGWMPSVRLDFDTMKLLPSKKVATAPPINSDPNIPLRIKQYWKGFAPNRLPLLCWNS